MAIPSRYDNFKFEPYKYREYPKWVHPVDESGKKLPAVLVEDRDEERLILKQPKLVAKSVTELASIDVSGTSSADTSVVDLSSLESQETGTVSEVEEPAAEDDASGAVVSLRKRCEELGVAFSERWGVTKLKRAIQQAQDDGAA